MMSALVILAMPQLYHRVSANAGYKILESFRSRRKSNGRLDMRQLLDPAAVGAERRERLDDLIGRHIRKPHARHHARRVEALARAAAIARRDRPVLALAQIVVGDVERM